MTKSEKKHASKNTLALLLIALPGITYLIINNYIPIIGTFIAVSYTHLTLPTKLEV